MVAIDRDLVLQKANVLCSSKPSMLNSSSKKRRRENLLLDKIEDEELKIQDELNDSNLNHKKFIKSLSIVDF